MHRNYADDLANFWCGIAVGHVYVSMFLVQLIDSRGGIFDNMPVAAVKGIA